jgi:hypothetical protein
MSYDVYIGDADLNMTSNIGKLLYDHIPDTGKGGGIRELQGLTGRQASIVLASAFERVEQTRLRLWEDGRVGEPQFCSRYDATNGWGSAIGGLVFMARIMGACVENPRKKVSVSL